MYQQLRGLRRLIPAVDVSHKAAGSGTKSVFVPLPVALARVPLLPAHDLPGEPVSSLVREGMFLASRHAGVLVCGTEPEAWDARAAATVRGYTLRARTRPTPHGAFAGVAVARFADPAPPLTLGAAHRARTVPDPGWLHAVAERALDLPGVLEGLTFWTNNLAARRGDRIEHERPAEPGTRGVSRVSVRATDPAVLLLRICAAGASWTTITEAITSTWPGTGRHVRRLVLELVRTGLLLTDLLGEHHADSLGHLAAKLPPGDLVDDLAQLRRLLADADAHPVGTDRRLTALFAARDTADRVLEHDHPLRADVSLDATNLLLPRHLARDAATAAGLLWSIGFSTDPLKAFHRRFLARYGPHRPVRLLTAIDPVEGVGGTDPGDAEFAASPQCAAILASLTHRAVADGLREIELDDATLRALTDARGGQGELPPGTAEIYVRVLSDPATGRLRLAVSPAGGTQRAGSSSGRFVSLLPALHVDYLGRLGETSHPAEMVVRGRTPSGAALAPETGLASHRLPLGVPARPGDLAVHELLLVSDGQRLTLWSPGLDQPIIPILFSRISDHLLPPVAAFLRMLGQQGARPWKAWSWGPLTSAPFCPRIRYRSTIVAPARWTLPGHVISSATATDAFAEALEEWRTTTTPTPPHIVVITDHDRALPVDLRHSTDRGLLRRHLLRGGDATVTEQPGGGSQGVVTGPDGPHALELVIPLVSTRPPAPIPPYPATERGSGVGVHLPGGPWLSLRIGAALTCQDDVLTRLLAFVGDTERWFWLRYADHAGPHLRVRFHGEAADLGGRLLPALSQLIHGLIGDRLASGLALEPYDPEIERYGGTAETMQAAEQVFMADSRLVLDVLASAPAGDRRIVVAALSAAAIARAVADGAPAVLSGRHLDRATRRRMDVLRPATRAAAAQPAPHAVLWKARQEALAAYRAVLDPGRRIQCASSLVHMHINRLLGGTADEPLVRALAADLLFARTPAHTP